MSKHKSEDYKITAVKYYLENDTNYTKTCDIFKCSDISTNWLEEQDKLLISIDNLKNLLVRYGKNPAHYILDQPISSILILTFP